ncbi:hypothetical protein CLV98_12122 [Dyadobacter jejuensis]|uniref:Uncharacterized protein n=1 Tax=Dyadobacter jejuensis TaxID=1082580 RepID=A0A316A9S8_9BACT|nr:hypothetical protein [Dyadobacter jejuensis]PWJ53750.1 hypothetical protein CLV98_12122 [Dyadobacter jejuensis]
MKSKFSKLFLGSFLFLFSFSPTLSEDNGCQDYCMASYSQQEEEAYAWWSGSLDSLYWDAAIFLVGAWSGYLSQSS